MKYTVEGFNQEKMVEAGLDCTDAMLLRWFVDFAISGRMKEKMINGKSYYWVLYRHVIEDLPLARINDKTALSKRFKKLVSAHFLDHIFVKEGGSYSYFGAGPALAELLSSLPPSDSKDGPPQAEKSDPLLLKSKTPIAQKHDPLLLKNMTKDSSTNDPSTNDSSKMKEVSTPPSPPTRNTASGVKEYKPRVEFNFDTGMFRGISDEKVNRWADAFPALEVETELAKAAAWLQANPAKRKKNIQRFLVNWLSRAQERGGDRVSARR